MMDWGEHIMGDSSRHPKEFDRRTLLGLLGAATLQGAARAAEKLTFPKNAVIRTILKDLSPSELASGITLFHEHITTESADGVVIEELNAARQIGVTCIVNARSERAVSLPNLKAISTRTNVHIVHCAGYYMEYAYPPEIRAKSEDQIAEDFVREIQRDHIGALGEIGQSPNSRELSPLERKMFRAVGKTHLQTNLPIFTHNPYGTGPNVPREAGLRQLDAFEEVGVRPDRVAIGHVCCLDDSQADVMKQLAKRGAYVGFDRMSNTHPAPPPGSPPPRNGQVHDISDEQRVKEILAFLDAGYEKQLLLADDNTLQPLQIGEAINRLEEIQWLTGESSAKIKAMIFHDMGTGRTVSRFAPKLRKAGVKEKTLHTILYDNPRRFLAFEPKIS